MHRERYLVDITCVTDLGRFMFSVLEFALHHHLSIKDDLVRLAHRQLCYFLWHFQI
jgi:hypothetical protein